MPVFLYSGQNTAQTTVRGTITADSARHARDQLRNLGVVVESLRELNQSQRTSFRRFATHRARLHWTTAAHELSMLLRAGIPILESLETIASQYRGEFRNALIRIRDRVAAGSSLANAMSAEPDVFDFASIRMVEVGERSGTLEAILEQVSEYRMRLSQLGDKVLTALFYPSFLLIFGLAAMLFLMTQVLPPLFETLIETIGELPWPTRIAKGLSDFLVGYGLWLLFGFGVFFFISLAFLRSTSGRLWWDRWVVRLPWIGPMIIKQNVSRIAMIVGLLIRNGLTLPDAVEVAGKSTHHLLLRHALNKACEDMAAGKELSESLDRSGQFPPLAVRVFSVGRDTGKLDEMLTRLSDDYNQQLSVATARLTAILEPILILLLATFVGFLLIATILPILQAGNLQTP